jgi:predicted ATPase/DNA-binding winged helix-turn-helix (wHTH) protein
MAVQHNLRPRARANRGRTIGVAAHKRGGAERLSMPNGRNLVFAFSSFRLFATERRLEKAGKLVPLRGRALDLLIILVERAGEVVANRTLLEDVWLDVNVEESSLRFHIRTLRKILGEDQPDARYIANVPGRGYCFVAPVERTDRLEAPASDSLLPGPRTNLPTRASAIIGRTDNIEAVSRELARRRIVTITGPGGIGKTTLAIATAEALRTSFDDAVFFVDLVPIEDPALVVSALASALGVALRADDPVSAIVDFLRDKRCLIVLDNCEQVIDAAATLAERISQDTKGTHLLITSRESLRIAGERVHRLMPLECPPIKAEMTPDEAMMYAAVRLFVSRATASLDGFSLDTALAPVAGEICRRLDGIPLAIELAAARVEFFGVAALAKGLNDMFALLTKGRRFALPRHQTLRATLDWGYNLLSPIEQIVLRRIASFRATFTLESALAVIVGPQVSLQDALDAIANLVAKSLLCADNSSSETVQYRLLESTRQYATEKLVASGEMLEAARRHAEHHVKLLENTPVNWESTSAKHWLQLYAGRIDDVRAALDWSFSPGGDPSIGLQVITASARLWFKLSLILEYRERIERSLLSLSEGSQPDAITEMRLQFALGYALWYSAGPPDSLERAFARALELADQVGDGPARLQALWGVWAAHRARGQYQKTLAVAERYQAVARTTGDPAATVLGDRILGLTHHYLGNQDTARRILEPVLSMARRAETAPNAEFQLGPDVATGTVLTRIYWLQGFPDRAMATLQEAIAAAQRADHWFSLYYVLCFAGCPLSLWIGDLAQTQTCLDMIRGRAMPEQTRRSWVLILRLRQGDERDALIASFLEPRLDLSTAEQIAALTSTATISLPQPNDDAGDAHWSLPEILRVNAELLLWHRVPDAAAAAESKLLAALDIARQQSTLSWELRSATSLARLWHRSGRVTEARDLLAATCDRFTEGFDTADVVKARRLITEWS